MLALQAPNRSRNGGFKDTSAFKNRSGTRSIECKNRNFSLEIYVSVKDERSISNKFLIFRPVSKFLLALLEENLAQDTVFSGAADRLAFWQTAVGHF